MEAWVARMEEKRQRRKRASFLQEHGLTSSSSSKPPEPKTGVSESSSSSSKPPEPKAGVCESRQDESSPLGRSNISSPRAQAAEPALSDSEMEEAPQRIPSDDQVLSEFSDGEMEEAPQHIPSDDQIERSIKHINQKMEAQVEKLGNARGAALKKKREANPSGVDRWLKLLASCPPTAAAVRREADAVKKCVSGWIFRSHMLTLIVPKLNH